MSEIKQVMDYLGRGIQDGEVRGSHLGQILMYLKRTKKENMKVTLSKLALICGTSQRNLRENYLEGLGNFGIIDIRTEGHSIVWDWIGESAFNNKPVMSEIRKPKDKELLDLIEKKSEESSKTPFTDAVKELKKKKINKCRNPECKKVIPDTLAYCNRECLMEHMIIKKEKK